MEKKIDKMSYDLDLFRGFQHTVLKTIRQKADDEKLRIKDIKIIYED